MSFSIFSLQGLIAMTGFFFGGLVDAVSGGGGLITVPALIMAGIPMHNLIGTNQASAIFGAVTSFLRFRRSGYINWTVGKYAVPAALLGGAIGARINLLVPEDALRLILIILIPAVAVITFLKKDLGQDNRFDTLPHGSVLLYALAIGFFIGMYQGFYGAGSGTFFILAFSLLLRMDLLSSSATTKVMVLASVLTGCATYVFSGTVLWQAVFPCAAANILGSLLGAKIALTKGAKVIRPMFLAVLVVLIIKMLTDFVL